MRRLKGFAAGLTIALLVVGMSIGCAAYKKLEPPSVEYVKADIQFEELLGDRIALWIEEDPVLTETEKEALDLALTAWRAMVDQAAVATGNE